jgi:hypothetical protein
MEIPCSFENSILRSALSVSMVLGVVLRVVTKRSGARNKESIVNVMMSHFTFKLSLQACLMHIPFKSLLMPVAPVPPAFTRTRENLVAAKFRTCTALR